MRESALCHLHCPVDLGSLEAMPSRREDDGHIMEGTLKCCECGTAYPITEGIPDLLPRESASVAGEDLGDLQAATVERFGWEWRQYRDWGWLPEFPDVPDAEERFMGGTVESTRRAFWGKTLFERGDLQAGQLVLDAGCGNGRFTNQAAQTGAVVCGIDIGGGVLSAFEHTRALPNVHIVRGDLFRLPFRDATFDRAFSIGVLMHTGNAEAALESTARTVRPGGLLLAHVYGKGRRAYEVADAAIRAVTTRLSIRNQVRFARATAYLARWLRRGGPIRSRLHRLVFRQINLLPTEHHMFDWWSAPIATHHTPEEVRGWFEARGFEILRSRPAPGDEAAERARRCNHGAVTVLGRRPAGG